MCAREGASRCGTLCSEKVLEREVWLDTVVSRDRATLKSASSLPFSSFELALCCAALPGRGEGRRKPWLSMPRGDRHQHRAKLSAQVPTEPVMGATRKLFRGVPRFIPCSAASLVPLVDAFLFPTSQDMASSAVYLSARRLPEGLLGMALASLRRGQ